jgi:hypothetical protein
MAHAKKVILHSLSGYREEMDAMITQLIKDGVIFVGVVGTDCARIEEIIDELCVGDGSNPHFMLTSSHPDESLEEAIHFASQLTGEFAGPSQVIEL